MDASRKFSARLFLLLLLGTMTGCVRGQVIDLARYDVKTDEFHFLQSYLDISAASDQDKVYLKALWTKRDHLMVDPFDLRLFHVPAFERQEKHRFRGIFLGKNEPGQAVKTEADLDSIRVLPGQFVLDEKGRLCAYQKMVVPGKVVDALRLHLDQSLTQMVPAIIRHEQTKDPGYRAITWPQMTQQMLASLAKPDLPMPLNQKELLALEPASHELLKKMKDVKLRREKGRFRFEIPLSEKDREGMFEMCTQLRKKAGTLKEPRDPAILFWLGLECRVIDTGVELWLEPAILHSRYPTELTGPASAKTIPKHPREVSYLEDTEIPVNRLFSLPQMVREFLAKDQK